MDNDEKKKRAQDLELRRRAALAAMALKYLSYVDEHHSDDGFTAISAFERQQLRKAMLQGGEIRETTTGLELTDKGRRSLNSAGPHG